MTILTETITEQHLAAIAALTTSKRVYALAREYRNLGELPVDMGTFCGCAAGVLAETRNNYEATYQEGVKRISKILGVKMSVLDYCGDSPLAGVADTTWKFYHKGRGGQHDPYLQQTTTTGLACFWEELGQRLAAYETAYTE